MAAPCTLNLSAATLAHRKYGRLWAPGVLASRREADESRRWLRHPRFCRDGVVAVDIGSFVGDDLFSFLAKCKYRVSVHTFEPIAAIRERLLERRNSTAEQARLHSHPFGLGASNHTACFGEARAVGAAGTMALANRGDDQSCASAGPIVDAAVALQSLVSFVGSTISIMQINCEGCEYDVLERLLSVPEQQSPLGSIDALEVQFHLSVGPQRDTRRYCAIEEGLVARGYTLDYRHAFAWERWSRRADAHDAPTASALPSVATIARAASLTASSASHPALCGRSPRPPTADGATCTGNLLSTYFSRKFGINSSHAGGPPTWHHDAAWHPHVWASAEAYVSFVHAVAPLVPSTYACRCGIEPLSNFSDAVALHVRCSDAPFARNKDYHLPEPAYWPYVIRRLREARAPRRLVILADTTHHTHGRPTFPNDAERRACTRHAEALGAFFERHGFETPVYLGRGGGGGSGAAGGGGGRGGDRFELGDGGVGGSSTRALEVMLGAHTLVASMASSFSWFSGIAKISGALGARERFITPLMYREEEEREGAAGMSSASPMATGTAAAATPSGAPTTAAAPPPTEACGVNTKLDVLFVGKVDRHGQPCKDLVASAARYPPRLAEAVPWSMHEESQPLLHGTVAGRAPYLERMATYETFLAATAVPSEMVPTEGVPSEVLAMGTDGATDAQHATRGGRRVIPAADAEDDTHEIAAVADADAGHTCVMVMYDAASFASWGHLVARRLAMWSHLRGYELILRPWCEVGKASKQANGFWCKVSETRALLSERPDCALVLHVDGDAMVGNVSYTAPWPRHGASLTFSRHALNGVAGAGMINAGVFAVRNTAAARRVFNWWASYGNGTCRVTLDHIGFPEQICAEKIPTLFPRDVEFLPACPSFNCFTTSYTARDLRPRFESCMASGGGICHPAGTTQWCRHWLRRHCSTENLLKIRLRMYAGWWGSQAVRGLPNAPELDAAVAATLRRVNQTLQDHRVGPGGV